MPQAPNQASGFDFTDSPGGDTTLDDLFGSNGDNASTQTTTQEPQAQGTPEGDQPFLSTATGTVYKTADDAIKGIEHKDAYITELRQKLAEAESNKPPVTKAPPTQEEVNYHATPEKYFEHIKAAKSNEELLRIQARFVQEELAPYQPLVAGMAKTQAVETIARETPAIRTFIGSDEYSKTLEKFPLLKQSIQMAEASPQAAGNLTELYRLAYSSAGVAPSTPAVREPQTARPTVASATTAPPAGERVAPPSMATSEGRKAIMSSLASKVEDFRF